jgi:hypothetical protein
LFTDGYFFLFFLFATAAATAAATGFGFPKQRRQDRICRRTKCFIQMCTQYIDTSGIEIFPIVVFHFTGKMCDHKRFFSGRMNNGAFFCSFTNLHRIFFLHLNIKFIGRVALLMPVLLYNSTIVIPQTREKSDIQTNY